jgi:rieske iron-sulfur protein
MSRDEDRRQDAPTEPGASDASTSTPSETERQDILQRRRVIQAGVGVGVVLGLGGLSALSVGTSLRPPPNVTPEREPPADGDELVLADDQEHVLTPDDVPLASGLALAYPRNPDTLVVKAGTLNNLTVLTRFDPATLSAETSPYAAEGVVAYSAVCPHLGCTVTSWDGERNALHCLCHHAYFDPRDEAELIEGPSPGPLPGLPLKVVDGKLIVAGGFLGPVGPQ